MPRWPKAVRTRFSPPAGRLRGNSARTAWNPGAITRVDSDVMPIFRHEFTVEPKPVKRALAFVCGLGHFELALNGANVGDHVLIPDGPIIATRAFTCPST